MDEIGYAEFRKRYEARHPASVPKKRQQAREFPRWLMLATLIMFISSAVLSGVHTIPVVRAGIPSEVDAEVAQIVSFAAFFSVELAILLSAYAMIGGGGLVIGGVLVLATLTALVANVYSVITAYNEANLSGDIWTLLVAIIIGVVAPGIALLSGKMFVNMHKSDREASQASDSAFLREARAWDATIEAAWHEYQSKMEKARERDRERSRTQENAQTVANNSPTGRENPTPAEMQVIEFLRTNPDAVNWSRSELADAVGVAKSTASYGARWMKVRPEFMNGHSKNGQPSDGE